jgi:hypothetical protein
MKNMRDVSEPPLTEGEIAEELKLVRAARKASGEAGR